MTLATVWFFVWGLLWAIYFMTDGFDLGVGALLPFLAKDETQRRTMYNATGPLWDGNEVWLITAGGVGPFHAYLGPPAAIRRSGRPDIQLLVRRLHVEDRIIRCQPLEDRHR